MEKPPLRLQELIDTVQSQHHDSGPLQHLTDSVTLASHLGELADHLIGHFVDQARDAGASWTEIGHALGVTKQAAQKRFVPRPSELSTLSPKSVSVRSGGGLARYTDEAKAIIVGAMEHARRARHDHIGSEHIVLALVDDLDGPAACALAAQGFSPETVRAAVDVVLAPAEDTVTDVFSFAADARKALDLALREALRMGDGHVGPEHILLGVFRDQKSLGAMTLAGLGIHRKKIEKGIAR